MLALITSVMAMAASAQGITAQQEREFYQKTYSLFNQYALSASVSDEEEEYTFRKLFSNGDLMICNDLMSLSREKTLKVDDYIKTLQDAKRVKVVVRNIKKDGPIEDGGDVWTLPVVFEKSISYAKSGTLFNSYDYFGEYYHLRAIVVFSKFNSECYIGSLEADPKHEWKKFPEKFNILVRTRKDDNKRNYERDSKLTINGRDVQWNLYGQVILHDEDKVRYNNSLVELEEITTGRDGGTKLHANYNDKPFRIKANMGFSLSGFNKLDGANKEIKTPKNNEMSYGLDFGYVLPSTSKFYVGFFTGVNMSSNSLTMSMMPQEKAEVTDITNCTEDEDGDTYTRHYVMNGDGVSQELKSSELVVPLYVDFEYQVVPLVSIYADLGMKLQMTSGSWTANIDGYETSGKNWSNPLYKDVVINGDVDLNGFGSWPARSIDVDEDGMSKATSINIMAGFGLRFNLNKAFAFDAGVQYITGGNSWKMEGNKKHIFDYKIPSGATTKEEKAKGDRVNLLRQAKGIKHSALRVSASLIYKF